MQIVIDIPKKTYEQLKFLDEHGILGFDTIIDEAVANGTPLPKGHGRLIDADAFERRCMFDSNIEDMQDVIYALRDYKPIIEAESEET